MVAALCATLLRGQTPPVSGAKAPPPNPWTALEFLLGAWSGLGSLPGGASTSTGMVSFAFELNGKVLVRRNLTELSPISGEGPSQFHEDLLLVYQEQGDASLKAIFFDNEGHTIHYSVTVPSPSRVVFESLGGGKALRFRLTHALSADGTLSTELATAPPGGEFKVYTQGVTRKVK